MMLQTDFVCTRTLTTAHPMSTSCVFSVYDCVSSDMLRSVDETDFQENVADVSQAFARMFQVYSSVTASSVNATGIVEYPALRMLLKGLTFFRRFLRDHGRIPIAFVPVATSERVTDAEDSGVCVETMRYSFACRCAAF